MKTVLKINKFLFAFLFIGGIFLICDNEYRNTYGEELKENKDTELILLDPGHGGFDGGAEVNGIKEKEINLSIGLVLKEELVKSGYRVAMTREKDEAVKLDKSKHKTRKSEDLEARCKMKDESNCSMFISIHMNTFSESKYSGAQVWYSKNQESKIFASIIQKNFKEKIDSDNNRVEKAAMDSYKVLRCSDGIPAVIVECGFLSNPQEREKLNDECYQKKISETIAKAVNEYYLGKYKAGISKQAQ